MTASFREGSVPGRHRSGKAAFREGSGPETARKRKKEERVINTAKGIDNSFMCANYGKLVETSYPQFTHRLHYAPPLPRRGIPFKILFNLIIVCLNFSFIPPGRDDEGATTRSSSGTGGRS